jgi:hypothetical protein
MCIRAFLSRFMLAIAWVVFLSSTSVPASSQWLNYPTAGIPRTADGKPNLAAPTPKTADGKPDLSGLWMADDGKHFFDLGLDLKPNEVPSQPWAKKLSQERQDTNHRDDPLASCMPAGVPRMGTNAPFKIVQTPQLVIVLYETTAISTFRQIFTDGRPLPKDPQPTWLGYSVGTWEGDTFKVDTIGFNDRGWIDTEMGHPQTEALHLTERFRRPNFGHMEIGYTIDDPKAYTHPWSGSFKVHLMPDTDLLEMTCENAKDAAHMVGK